MTRVAVEFVWQPMGVTSLDAGRPTFPHLPDVPGLYRFTFEWPDRAHGVYIGETDGLRRRAQRYRTPGPTQRTNVRMNKEIVAALATGVKVTLSVVTTASMTIDGGAPSVLDLVRKTGRQVVENAAMAEAITQREADPAGGPVLMNRPGVGEAEWT